MKQIELNSSLVASLYQMYDMEVINSLAEFWQGELRVLAYVFEHSDSEINPSVLSDALHVSRARITTALSALRLKGYITMELCENDRRRMRVKLTADGKSYIKKKQRKIEKNITVLVTGLGEANVMELMRLIDLSVRIMDTASAKR